MTADNFFESYICCDYTDDHMPDPEDYAIPGFDIDFDIEDVYVADRILHQFEGILTVIDEKGKPCVEGLGEYDVYQLFLKDIPKHIKILERSVLDPHEGGKFVRKMFEYFLPSEDRERFCRFLGRAEKSQEIYGWK